MPENRKIYEEVVRVKPDQRWLDNFDPGIINPRLFRSFKPESLKRPAHEKKSQGGTAYVLLESSTGIPLTTESIGHNCGAACRNCYLIRGGARPDYTPNPTEALKMKQTLENKGFSVIFTGAELLTLPDYFEAGIFDEKPYLLTSGLLLAAKPEESFRAIAKAGINNIQMSLHGGAGSEDVFRGVPADIVMAAVDNIKMFNQKFGTKIGVVLNVTVAKHNLALLETIADLVLSSQGDGGIDCDGIRFNRHKAAGGKFRNLMLDEADHEVFYQTVEKIRKKYPLKETQKTVNVSGDFGKLRRPGRSDKPPYECPAGIPGGEITIVPRKSGCHEVYSCLEVRNQQLQMGVFYGDQEDVPQEKRGQLELSTKPFEMLKDSRIKEAVGLTEDGDGCIAYSLTRNDHSARAVMNFLTDNLDLTNPDIIA